MDVRDLAPFVAVAEELHFGRAAKRLGTAQPPLSRQIQRLEQDLGVTLLVRSKRGTQLTAAGRAFLDEARAALAQAERAVATARRVANGEVGRLRVGHVDSASSELLPGVLRAFRKQAPEVRIALVEDSSEILVEAVKEGELDAALVRPPVHHVALVSEVVASEPLVAVLPDTHPLAAREEVPLASLAKEAFVLFPRRACRAVYDRVIASCAIAGFHPDVAEEAFPLSSVALLVSAGMGVSLVPAFVADRLCQSGVAYRSLEGDAPAIDLCVAWRLSEISPAVHAFIELVRTSSGRFIAEAP